MRARWLFGVGLVALVGCGGDKTGEDTSDLLDEDGDGWTVGDGDCDDTRYAVHPGLNERCNGRDDDCNGEIDEDYPDDDHDGVIDCYEGEACNGEDDNANDEVDEGWPDADGDGDADCVEVEDCDGLDNDGDGEIDEGFDADGDGASGCEAASLVDCDDADAARSPLLEEVDGTQIDEDCDERVDEGDWSEGDLTLTEIMFDPAYPDDESGEWFEVLNTSGRELVLNGLELVPNGSDVHMVAGDELILLAPGEYFIFGVTDYIRGVSPDYAYNDFVLGDTADSLTLVMEDLSVDEVIWGPTTGKPDVEEGSSLSLDPGFEDATSNDDDGVWCGATESYTGSEYDLNNGSPGRVNELCSNIDRDGDGFSEDDGDCDDADITAWPGNVEVWYDGVDEDCDGASDYDADGDTYNTTGSPRNIDCDDTDASIHPDAFDTWYDGVDADCDGASDYDADGDGYDYLMYGGTDCLDVNDEIHPGATELCDGGRRDEDCDGLIDDEDDPVDEETTYYIDADGDGYGSSAETVDACEAPSGYDDDDDDCDDGDASINPAGTESWYDGVDQDCATDSDFDADGDGHDGDAWGGDDCDDADSGSYPGAPDFLGSDENTCGVDPLLVEASSRIGDEASAYLGRALAAAGDVDGDGLDDLLIGAQGGDSSLATDAGVAYLVLGRASGLDLNAEDATLHGQSVGDRTAASLAGLHDWDGDGYREVAVGAPYHNDTSTDMGLTTVSYGPLSGDVDLSAADASILGVTGSDYSGSALVSLDDWDGDGVPEFALGAPGDDSGGSAAGSVFVMAAASGASSLSTAGLELIGERSSDGAGNALATADVDGDGTPDLLVGAYTRSTTRYSSMGAVYLVLGPSSGSVDLSLADAILEGSAASDALGTGLSSLGDVDGDGYDDFAAGAPGYDGGATGAGAVWVFHGPITGTSTAASVATAGLRGARASEALGTTVAGTGDVDGDGVPDLASGAPAYGATATNGGALYVFTGPFSGTLSTTDAADVKYGASTSVTGFGLAGPGDMDGDGLAEVATGAWGLSTTVTSGGAAYLLSAP